MEELAHILGLQKPPRIIESYDISNWGDGTSVCGMVVFENGKPKRSGYRRFKMRTVAGTDDYASMAETLSRRAEEYRQARQGYKPDGEANQFAALPDLILLDGGKGQVSAVKQALRGTMMEHVPLYGMVKDDHHRTRAIVDGEGREIAIQMNRGTFTFVTSIQDEVHRYANEYRKQQHNKKSYASTLTDIPGIGPATARMILKKMGSVTAVREAAREELEALPGIGPKTAEAIWNYFHNPGA